MLFGLTLTKNKREGFDEDVKDLKHILECLKADHFEVGDVGFELQPDGMCLLHLHTTVAGHMVPYMMRYQQAMKDRYINFMIKQIPDPFDRSKESEAYKWWQYCMKNKGKDLPALYADSVQTNRTCLDGMLPYRHFLRKLKFEESGLSPKEFCALEEGYKM